MRKAKIKRVTTETQIELELNLDGKGQYDIDLGLGFLTHMLEIFSRHSMIDLKIKATGDLKVDDHHLTEDIAIVLGEALKQALADKKGIKRYGYMILPMDEVLCLCSLDLSGRFAFATDYQPERDKISDFSTDMMAHFFSSLAVNAGMNLHIKYLEKGFNEHHKIEAAMKAFARALREAITQDPRLKDQLPTTKGKL